MAFILNNPLQLMNPAIKLHVSSISVTDSNMNISYRWVDASENTLLSSTITITGQDFSNIINAEIQGGYVGWTLGKLLRRLAYNRLKNMLSLVGTIEE